MIFIILIKSQKLIGILKFGYENKFNNRLKKVLLLNLTKNNKIDKNGMNFKEYVKNFIDNNNNNYNSFNSDNTLLENEKHNFPNINDESHINFKNYKSDYIKKHLNYYENDNKNNSKKIPNDNNIKINLKKDNFSVDSEDDKYKCYNNENDFDDIDNYLNQKNNLFQTKTFNNNFDNKNENKTLRTSTKNFLSRNHDKSNEKKKRNFIELRDNTYNFIY